jgi:hypothetical protein
MTTESRGKQPRMADLEGAVLGDSKAVYPCRLPMLWFPGTRLPQRGLARNEFWTFDSAVMDSDAGVLVRLTNLCADGFRADDQGLPLRPNPTIAKLYAKDFQLAYFGGTRAQHGYPCVEPLCLGVIGFPGSYLPKFSSLRCSEGAVSTRWRNR